MSEETKSRSRVSTPLDLQLELISLPLPMRAGKDIIDPYYLLPRLETLGKAGYTLRQGIGNMSEEELN